jgi:hypothetical protein
MQSLRFFQTPLRWLAGVAALVLLCAALGQHTTVQADATCTDYIDLSDGQLGQPGAYAANRSTVCLRFQVSNYAQIIKVTMKPLDNWAQYDLYLEPGAWLSNLTAKGNLRPIAGAGTTGIITREDIQDDYYVLAIAPLPGAQSNSRFELTISDELEFLPVDLDSDSSGDLSSIPGGATGIIVPPKVEIFVPFSNSCLNVLQITAYSSHYRLRLYRPDGSVADNKVVQSSGETTISYPVRNSDLAAGINWWASIRNRGNEPILANVRVQNESIACAISQPPTATPTQPPSTPPTPQPATAGQMRFQYSRLPTTNYNRALDVTLEQSEPNTNFGPETTCYVDGDEPPGAGNDRNTLLYWDVSTLPAGSRITAVSVRLNVVQPTEHEYYVYGLTHGWDESQATWYRAHQSSNWNGPGAMGDIDAQVGFVGPWDEGSHTFQLNGRGVQLVQSWLDNPGLNHGLLLTNSSATDGLDFECSESTSASNRPMLIVDYVTP